MNRFQFYYDSSDDDSSSMDEKGHVPTPLMRVDVDNTFSKNDPSFQNSRSPRGVDELKRKRGGNEMIGGDSNDLNSCFETTSPGASEHRNGAERLVTERPVVEFGKPITYKIWFEKYIYPKLIQFENSSTSDIGFIIEDSVNDFLCDGGMFRDDRGGDFSSSLLMSIDATDMSKKSSKEYKRLLKSAKNAFHQIYSMNKKRKMNAQETEKQVLSNISGASPMTNDKEETLHKKSSPTQTKETTVSKNVPVSSTQKSDAAVAKVTPPKKKSTKVDRSKKVKTVSTKSKSKNKSSSTSKAKSSGPKKRKRMEETTVPKAKKTSNTKQKGITTTTPQKKNRNESSMAVTIASKSKSNTKSSTSKRNKRLSLPSIPNHGVETKDVPQEISISSNEESPLHDDNIDSSDNIVDDTSLITQDMTFNTRSAFQSVVRSKRSLVSGIHVYDSGISRFVNVSNPKMYTCALDKLTHLFKCPVCLDIMKDVYIVPNCLHRICYKCANDSIRKCNHRCPECRISVPTKRLLRNDELYEELKIKIFGEGGLIENIGRNSQVQNDRLRKSMSRYFLCSQCNSLPNKTCVVPECLHRFCSDCVDEECDTCPECEIMITSKLPIREDSNFDELRHLLISDGGILD